MALTLAHRAGLFGICFTTIGEAQVFRREGHLDIRESPLWPRVYWSSDKSYRSTVVDGCDPL